jgi:hypothetical protein
MSCAIPGGAKAQAQSARIAATLLVIRFAIFTRICPSFAPGARLALALTHASRARFNSFLYGARQIGHRRDYRSCAGHPKLVGELGGRVASTHESDCAHARRNRGAYTERRIFDDDAVGGSCSDRASRKEVEIGGLAPPVRR